MTGIDGPSCPFCDYCLIGLSENRCPECGAMIDLASIRVDSESYRNGTPVRGVRGIQVLPRTVQTIFLLLFRPISLGKRLRHDEPFLPPLHVAFFAISPFLWIQIRWPFGTPMISGIAQHWRDVSSLVMQFAFGVILFGLLCGACTFRTGLGRFPFVRRFRLWCLVGMYSMVLLVPWPWFCAGTRRLDLLQNGIWPVGHGTWSVTILIVWWVTVLSLVSIGRYGSPRRTILFVGIGIVFVTMMVHVADWSLPRFAR